MQSSDGQRSATISDLLCEWDELVIEDASYDVTQHRVVCIELDVQDHSAPSIYEPSQIWVVQLLNRLCTGDIPRTSPYSDEVMIDMHLLLSHHKLSAPLITDGTAWT